MTSKEAQPNPQEIFYREQLQRLQRDTFLSSSVHDQIDHPAMAEIISLGGDAVTFIIQDFKEGNRDIGLFHALREITGENPVREEDRGNVKKMAESWVEWDFLKKEQDRRDR